MRRHVLAARLDSAGDVLLCGPALRALAGGTARLTLLCGPAGEPAARLLPDVDDVIVFEAPWVVAKPPPVRPDLVQRLVDQLALLRLDEAVVFTSFHQSPLPLALVLRLAGVPRISAISLDYPGSLLDVRHHEDDDIHEVQRALSLAAAAGFNRTAGDNGALRVRRPGRLPAELVAHQPFVAVHPGAAASARAWAPERHRELVSLLAAAGQRVVVTGSTSERALTQFVSSGGGPSALDWGGESDFAQLADILAAAGALVAGNTGPAHLAAAVGTPVVSLFAPVVPACRWRPWMVPHVLLGDQRASCAGSRARTCPVNGHPCLNTVTAAEALAAVMKLLGTPSPCVEVPA